MNSKTCVLTSAGKSLLIKRPAFIAHRPLWKRALAFPLLLPLSIFVVVLSLTFSSFFFLRNKLWPTQSVQTAVSSTARFVALNRFLATKLNLLEDYAAYDTLNFVLRSFALVLHLQQLCFGKTIFSEFNNWFNFFFSRTIFFDDIVINAKHQQFVILGAGFDFRAHRLSLDEGCKVFEVDALLTQQKKKEIVTKYSDHFSYEKHNKIEVHYASVDFSKNENFIEKIKEQGFDVSIPATILMEGVTYYLEWEDLEKTLKQIAESCAAGSLLTFDFSPKKFPESLKAASKVGEPPKFGLDTNETPHSKFLPLGFSSVEVWLGAEELFNRYAARVENLHNKYSPLATLNVCCLRV